MSKSTIIVSSIAGCLAAMMAVRHWRRFTCRHSNAMLQHSTCRKWLICPDCGWQSSGWTIDRNAPAARKSDI